MTAVRLDSYLVRHGLARSRGHARELILAGQVEVDGSVPARPAHPVGEHNSVHVAQDGPSWVGRGAYKLLAAVEAFAPRGLRIRGTRCLDVGASTGGFTQVLLHHGAAQVVALDVGHGQLAAELVADPRVTERSGTNIRDVRPEDVGAPFDLIVGDLSFISLRLVLPHLAGLLAPTGAAVLLIKPQFEVGRAGLDKRGVVREEVDRRRAIADVQQAAADIGWLECGLIRSPIAGGEGNEEYLVWFSAASREDPDQG